METNNNSKKYKVATIILSILVVILAILLIYSNSQLKTIIIEKEIKSTQNNELTSELDSLMKKHEEIKTENSSISVKLTAKDSIIEANAAEIKKLIYQQADYNKIKRKLELLREMTQGYLQQLDSLGKVNKILVAENDQYKGEIVRYKETTTTLESEKKVLNDKVSTAAKLKAYSVIVKTVALKSGGKKESPTEKAKRTDRIRIIFTLSENPVASSGLKTLFCRIARPDGKVINISDGVDYSFTANDKILQYTVKQEIEYNNTSQSISMYWDIKNRKEEAIAGKYYVMLYVDGYQIGETSFDLK